MRMVAVVAGRLKDRSQIDRVDPQIGQMIQMLDDAQQIAAMKSLGRWRGVSTATRWMASQHAGCVRNSRGKSVKMASLAHAGAPLSFALPCFRHNSLQGFYNDIAISRPVHFSRNRRLAVMMPSPHVHLRR